MESQEEYEDYKFCILQSNMHDIWKLKKITKFTLAISIISLLLMIIHMIL